MNLLTPVSQLNRVGKTLEKRLRNLGIETIKDLLFHFPFRYEDYSQVVPIKDLREGTQVSVRGKVELIASKRSPRKRTIITEAVVADETGQLRVVWFGQPFIAKILKAGDTVYLSGKVTSDFFGAQMVGPAYELAKTPSSPPPIRGRDSNSPNTTHTARIVPMYSVASGITNKQLRFLLSQAMGAVGQIKEWLPEELRDRADVMGLVEAIKAIHFPESPDELKHSERRLKFDELFILQLRGELIRQAIKKSIAPKIEFKEKETKKFVDSLPFKLTKKQKIAAWEILRDLEKTEPMNRLLEGDVGSGKTVVAAMAMYNAALNGFQTALMCPTEILAFQHYETLLEVLCDKVSVGLFTRSQRMIKEIDRDREIKSKIKLQNKIKEGGVGIIVGTQTLLAENVEFKNLGLVIVDEQHRFGVEQRKVLREKLARDLTPAFGQTLSYKERVITTPHFLSMTATPIPRSFALTVFGDLDLSIIDEMPPGRKSVKTRLVEPRHREKAYQFIREQVKQGRQAFVVCPLIQNNENDKTQDTNKLQIINYKFQNDERKTVMAEYEKLKSKVFPDLEIGYLHGKMKSAEKNLTMEQFNNGVINILVSTSVIEVGVNVPNASVMMIEGAERFGLAQLHQFRGRVCRSTHQSYCFLFTDSVSPKVAERLKFFEQNTSGFKVAEYDLENRGPGEVYGTAQSGMENFRLATMKDGQLIKLARDLARGIDWQKYPMLKNKVEEWGDRVHLE
ncbi:MAG: ATP-dependent DNA helicase RecG [Candidatus Magasanikbacteria bacterium]|nr:ATP-dependent DNA helicase RecG [Candidatus Magasanikbacteria bacterium]